MFPEAEVVSWTLRVNVLGGERGGDADVDCEALGVLPTREGDIAWSTAWLLGVAKDASFFQDWGQKTLVAHLGDQIADAIVSYDDISILFAARGVVAVQVKRLHAKRTTDIRALHMNPKPIPTAVRKTDGDITQSEPSILEGTAVTQAPACSATNLPKRCLSLCVEDSETNLACTSLSKASEAWVWDPLEAWTGGTHCSRAVPCDSCQLAAKAPSA